MQYLDGSQWVDVGDQTAAPQTPAPNLNTVTFTPVTTQRLRVVMTPAQRADASRYGIGLKEIQVFRVAPTTVAQLRTLVRDLRAAGEVTRAGSTRLLTYLLVVDILTGHGRDTPAAALRALEGFIEVAGDPRYVPGERARHVLVDASEHLLAQLRGPGALDSGR